VSPKTHIFFDGQIEHDCGQRVLAMAILSVRLSVRPSVCHDPVVYRFKARWDIDSGSLPYDSLESIVSNEVILVPLGEEIPLELGHQRGVRGHRCWYGWKGRRQCFLW